MWSLDLALSNYENSMHLSKHKPALRLMDILGRNGTALSPRNQAESLTVNDPDFQ